MSSGFGEILGKYRKQTRLSLEACLLSLEARLASLAARRQPIESDHHPSLRSSKHIRLLELLRVLRVLEALEALEMLESPFEGFPVC